MMDEDAAMALWHQLELEQEQRDEEQSGDE